MSIARCIPLLVASCVALANVCRAQNDTPPAVMIVYWEVDRAGQAVDVRYDPANGINTFNRISGDLYLAGDVIRCQVRITDANWTGTTDTGDQMLFYQLSGGSADGPPIPSLSSLWRGVNPPRGAGETFIIRPMPMDGTRSIVLPALNGPSQARLLGFVAFDATYTLDIAVSSVQSPMAGQIGRDPRGPLTLRVVDNPALRPSNPPPFADAGADRTVAAGTVVTLDASGTFDSYNVGFNPSNPNIIAKDRLQFSWEWVGGPTQVAPAGQTSINSPTASVTLTDLGTYEYRLTVQDGVNPQPSTDTVKITVVQTLPVKHPPSAVISGPASAVSVGTVITLDGRGSTDQDGGTLTYRWVQTDALGDSLGVDQLSKAFQPLAGVDSSVSSWKAITAGTFYFRLLVSDGDFLSSATFSIVVDEVSSSAARESNPSIDSTDDSLSPTAALTGACGAGVLPMVGFSLLGLAAIRRSRI